MVVFVTICAAFGLIVSKAKTEIMRLPMSGVSHNAAIFNVKTAGQVYKQARDFVYLGGGS